VSKRYADGTTVTVESSRGEITGILAKHGVQRMAWATGPEGDQLSFELAGHRFLFRIDKPTPEEVRERDSDQYVYPHNIDWITKANQEWQRRWRANVLLLKAKLEFADGETSTVMRELLPYAMLADGRTVEDAINVGMIPLLASGSEA
jgi:hypothetical protein